MTSPIGAAPSTNQSDKQQSPSNQKGQQPSLFSKATVIKPKTAAEVAAKTLPIVSQFQQQILSPVSTMTSETSQLQGKQKTLSPNKQSILLTAQEGIAGKFLEELQLGLFFIYSDLISLLYYCYTYIKSIS